MPEAWQVAPTVGVKSRAWPWYARSFVVLPLFGKAPKIKDWSTQDRGVLWMHCNWENLDELTGFGTRLDGLTVIDIDDVAVPEALAVMAAIEETPTYSVRTGGGGFHFYYHGETESQFNLSWGEIKSGPGHQVVGPGSVHPDTGELYRPVCPRLAIQGWGS